ncbi:LysR family transcriptional regulator [Telmatospirillum siberiense]|uniref:LysR family transcriptional regulator n=1 Tax=Telmatospirillum siberiense TaxID=382514 RepID=A0A2N3PVR3_9PROT|nr:LysR family transcriptional regulator [Telmatospirillum siberiense]PKU24480.1 LysR family transcriptional regulator [Telmatospirillum siberiense]
MLHSSLLTYLDEVVRCGSIRKAAARLNIASSSINRRIIALEEEIGVPIFERLPRRLRLTGAGELLLAHVRQTLRDYELLQSRLVDLQGRRRGLVRISTMGGLANSLLPGLVGWMREHHPFIKLAIKATSVEGVMSDVGSGEADLGFAFQLPPDAKLRVVARTGLRVGAVVAAGHPLAERGSVYLGDCLGYPLILADRSMTIGTMVADAFERASIRVDLAVESNSIELMKQAVTDGQSITFLNEVDVEVERRAGRLVFLPLLDELMPRQELKLVERARGALDPSQSLVVEELRKIIQAIDEGDWPL